MISWVFLALGAAIVWGTGYALTERAVKELPLFVFLAIFYGLSVVFYIAMSGAFTPWRQALASIEPKNLWPEILVGVVCFALGNILIFMAIQRSNATVANMIEISYPIFTALAAWLIFKNMQLTVPVVAGGLLIFSGVLVIYMWEG